MIRDNRPPEQLSNDDIIDTINYYQRQIASWKRFKESTVYFQTIAVDSIKYLTIKVKKLNTEYETRQPH